MNSIKNKHLIITDLIHLLVYHTTYRWIWPPKPANIASPILYAKVVNFLLIISYRVYPYK